MHDKKAKYEISVFVYRTVNNIIRLVIIFSISRI
jgi:hypothetical protein